MTSYGQMVDDPLVLAEARRRAPACDCGERMLINNIRSANIQYQCRCGRTAQGDSWVTVARDIGAPAATTVTQDRPATTSASPQPTNRGDHMPDSTTAPSVGEVTNVAAAVARLEQIAAAHQKISSAEGFLGSLNRMEVGQDDQQRYRDAQEASRNAGAAWTAAATAVRQHNLPVGEAYQQSPGAGNKHANTNE